MILIDIEDQRLEGTAEVDLREEDILAILDECDSVDTPLEVKVRVRDARSFDEMGYIRPLDEALTSFRLVIPVLPFKQTLSPAAKRVISKNAYHACVHLGQLRQQGPEIFVLQASQNEIEAYSRARKSKMAVVR